MNERGDLVRPAPPAAVDADIVMFLLGPDGEFLDDEPADHGGRTLADVFRAFRDSMQAERAEHPHGRHALEPRPVQASGRPSKSGYRDEILVTLRSPPTLAVAEAVSGTFLRMPIPRLRVDSTSLTSRHFEVAWSARIRVPWWRTREVRLRLYPSPSLNVAVMVMSPCRPKRVAAKGFLRVGNRAMGQLRDRLDDAVDTSGRRADRS